MGRFDSRLTDPLPGAKAMLRILREGGFRGKRPKDEGRLVPRDPAPRLPPVGHGDIGLTWIGHATFLVQMGGIRIATDPVWTPRLPGNLKRATPPGLPLETASPQVVTVSHNHYDHQDAWTFKRLPRTTSVLCPLGSARWFTKRGFQDVHELDWWEPATVRGVRFTFVPAHHWSRRGPFDLNDSLWGGWVLEHGDRRLYHAGDTAYGKWFAEIGRRVGAPDIAMLPIGAYEPRWFMRTVHMDADEAVRAHAELGAGILATMHWGTFPLTREPILEPLERVRKAWERTGQPRDHLWDLPIGGSRVLREEELVAAAASAANPMPRGQVDAA